MYHPYYLKINEFEFECQWWWELQSLILKQNRTGDDFEISPHLVLFYLVSCLGLSIQHSAYPHLVAAPCPTGYFPCNTSDVCVEQRMNCDSKPDCPDNSDEWSCEDHIRKNYYDQLFKKRPDADREQNMSGCELRTSPNECNCSKMSLFCNHRKLRKIPLLLPQNVQEL
ncbi:g_PROTEIN_RECEP_F1_2 domain-containing protein [Caerostris extrusa]|uniref:G_PROTEIN_RECEP_F1_2 domain-containing protein n=1 Tax=Caerostris extrusa TaxID=172846 RepID=A0AAV4PX69_CAEEX|nr:g_PROTEIN_RECEP_F1_2 domain-containing protein [Caerostris extrusa]